MLKLRTAAAFCSSLDQLKLVHNSTPLVWCMRRHAQLAIDAGVPDQESEVCSTGKQCCVLQSILHIEYESSVLYHAVQVMRTKRK